MQKRFSELQNLKLFTADDLGLRPIGRVSDLLIEDGNWNVRYVVVSTSAPLSRRVLVSPAAVQEMDFETNSIATILSTQQVVSSPRLEDEKPISREYEQALVDYYGWPIYWFGRTMMKPQKLDSIAPDWATEKVDESGDSILRSASEICGYKIQSRNGPVGVMKDLVIQIESWTIDYATADSKPGLPTGSSMFSTSWIQKVDWSTRQVMLDRRKAALEPAGDHPQRSITGEPWTAQRCRTAQVRRPSIYPLVKIGNKLRKYHVYSN